MEKGDLHILRVNWGGGGGGIEGGLAILRGDLKTPQKPCHLCSHFIPC